tara:strand:- start:1587 stop:2645 length:1059 start_codon:yes stop_codon:yes gene_type:complete
LGKEKMVNVYVVVDEGYLRLIKHPDCGLLANLPSGFPSITTVVTEGISETRPGQTNDGDFKTLMLERLAMYVDIIKKHQGEIVVLLDADIVIFENFIDDIGERLKKRDFLHQGMGIMALNSNSTTIEFWESFLDKCRGILPHERQDGYPEIEFRDLIIEKQGEGWCEKLPPEYGYLCENTYMYHAMNGGSTLSEKRTVLNIALAINKNIKQKQPLPMEEAFYNSKYNTIHSIGYYCGTHGPATDGEEGGAWLLRQIGSEYLKRVVDEGETMGKIFDNICRLNDFEVEPRLYKAWKYSWDPDSDYGFFFDYKGQNVMRLRCGHVEVSKESKKSAGHTNASVGSAFGNWGTHND